MEPIPHIAVVDDHRDIRELVTRYLEEHGCRVSAAENAAAFRRMMAEEVPDLVVLDIMMPGEDGLSLCRHLRTVSQVPVIFLTAMAADHERITGLDLGGDDYLVKPFNPRELLSRIRAVLRRSGTSPALKQPIHQTARLVFADKVLDTIRQEVTGPDGVAIPLSTAEFRLLCAFLDHPGKVLSRDDLADLTSGRTTEAWDRSIDNQVSRLRRKVEDDPKYPVLIKTHWGDGYCFTGKVVSL